ERSGCRVVENPHARTRPLVDLDAVKTGVVFHVGTTLTDSPDLAGLQRIIPNHVIRSEFGRRYELLHAIITDEVTEVGVTELRSTDPLLLLFNTAAYFKAQPRRPLQVFIGHRHFLAGIHKLE